MSLSADRIRVLHIEDDPAFADLAAEYLDAVDEAIEVTSVREGSSGLSALDDGERFDCVVCDYDLPGANGIEILEEVRSRRPDLPFILFTGKGSEEVASEAISTGVTDYLRKGTGGDQFEVLANRIRNAVEARRAERKLAERESTLAHERAFTEDALNTLDDLFYVLDEDGTFHRWNDELCSVSGYEDGEIAEMTARELFPEEHRDRVEEAIREVFETGECSLEAPLLTKDGRRIEHEFSGALFVAPDGEARRLVGVGRDVRERKRRERRLRRLKQRYEAVFENAGDALFLIDVEQDASGPTFRYEALNAAHESRTGLVTEEVEGSTPHEVFGEEVAAKLTAHYERCLRTGEPITYRQTVELPSGERTRATKLSPVEVDGEIVQIVGVSRDVTDREQRKQELESFQRAVEQAADGIALLDGDEYVWVDETHVEMYGFDDKEDLLGHTWRKLYDEEEITRLEEEVFPVIAEEGHWRGEVTGTRPDGSQFPVELQLTVVDDGRLVCACRDMTERKRRERQLQHRTERLENLVDNLPGLAYRCRNEPGWPTIHVSGECEELTGYSASVLREGEVSWDDLIHPDDRERVWEQVQASLEEREPFELEYRIRDRCGRERWVWERGRGLYDEDGDVRALDGFIADITERKEDKRELERKSRRYQATLEDPNILAGRLDAEGHVMEVNQTALEYVDAEEPEIVGLPIWQTPWWQDRMRAEIRELVRSAAEGNYETYEGELRTAEDEPYHVEGSLRPVSDRDGDVVSIVISARDVTERKRREQALEETNRRLEAVLDTADAGIFIKDSDRRYQMMNPRAREMFGIGPEEDLGGLTDEQLLPEALHDQCRASDRRVLDEGRRVETEESMDTPEGQQTFLTLKAPLEDEDGEVSGICGVTTDISDRKRRERELQRTNRELQAVLDTADAAIFIKDDEGRYQLMNEASRRILDVPEDVQVQGLTDHDLLPIDVADQVQADDRRIMENGEAEQIEETLPRSDGERTMLTMKSPMRDEEGEVIGVCAVSTDITERRRAEDQLRRSERSLRQLYDITSDRDRSFEEQLDALLALGCERLGLSEAYLAETDLDAGLQRIESAHGEHEQLAEGETTPLGETYCRRTVEEEALTTFADARDQFADDPAYERFELGAYAGAPVRVDGKTWGTVCFASREPREPFSDAEEVFVELVSQWLGYELERRRTEAELREKNERLDRFASIVSHDLRNPLNVASGNLQLAKDVDGVQSPRLAKVEQAHERMSDLLEEVLTLARDGTDLSGIEEVSLQCVARQAWSNVETEDAALRLDGDRRIEADHGRLVQLLENLHRNAVEHAGPCPTVEVGRLAEGFFVEDDGPGIPETQRSKVLASGYTTEEEGTGLGLSIVERIAQAHGWEMQITEAEGGGARFEFRTDDPS